MDKKYIAGTCLVVVFALAAVALSNGTTGNNVAADFNWHGEVCPTILRADGTVNILPCNSNTITTDGLNHIKECIGAGTTTTGCVMKYLIVGNGTAPSSGSSSLDNEISDCGFNRTTAATYASNGNGNWSYSLTWTSTCDNLVVNTTALFNETSSGTMLAGTDFTDATLQTDDMLQVTYHTWVT